LASAAQQIAVEGMDDFVLDVGAEQEHL
jgi:hypothetical protein